MPQKTEIQQAIKAIRTHQPGFSPEIAIILGSGLGLIAHAVTNPAIIPYDQIPGFPMPRVVGHAGKLVMGELGGKSVVLMQGRFHYYEGHSMSRLAFPVQVLHALGAQKIIVTASTAGVNPAYKPGDLILIHDHINLSFKNPLTNQQHGNLTISYPALTPYYHPRLQEIALKQAARMNLKLHTGVYLFTTGPSFETPAEIRMMRKLGADVVGMSTVPEVITAKDLGMQVMAMTYAANMGSGMVAGKIEHEKTLGVLDLIKDDLISLLKAIISDPDF